MYAWKLLGCHPTKYKLWGEGGREGASERGREGGRERERDREP